MSSKSLKRLARCTVASEQGLFSRAQKMSRRCGKTCILSLSGNKLKSRSTKPYQSPQAQIIISSLMNTITRTSMQSSALRGLTFAQDFGFEVFSSWSSPFLLSILGLKSSAFRTSCFPPGPSPKRKIIMNIKEVRPSSNGNTSNNWQEDNGNNNHNSSDDKHHNTNTNNSSDASHDCSNL